MPGWKKLFDVYLEEFGSRPLNQRPLLMGLVITDGDADDSEEFAKTIAQLRDTHRVYITLAIIGYGAEHDNAFATYKKIAAANAQVKVISFGSETDPSVISRALLKMIE